MTPPRKYKYNHITKPDADVKTAPRKCITCGTVFNSEGPHNRMCPKCRRDANSAVWGDP